MSKQTIQATIAAALLARGEVQEKNNYNRYLRFTRKFKGLRAANGTLVPSASDGRWFIGRNGALRVGTKASSKGRAVDKRVCAVLIEEGANALKAQEDAHLLAKAAENKNPERKFIDLETLEFVTMEMHPDKIFREVKREAMSLSDHDAFTERFTS